MITHTPKASALAITLITASFALTGCGESGDEGHAHGPDSHEHAEETHTHADGTVHAGPDDSADDHGEHEHGEEVALAPATTDGMTVEFAQGHGALQAGQESHLVVKLPYNDGGSSIVRAWIGSDDRTLSFVGKGEYAPSHDDYDIHVMAPDPLAEDAMWWIEIEKPDGTKVLASTAPIR